MNQLVFKNNNQVVTSSRNVARDFDKNHREVLRAIDNIIKNEVVQDCTTLFHEGSYTHEQNKQEYRHFLMNRDGFTLLVMGFEGRKAMQFKFDYMNAFNQMESTLQQPRILTEKEQLKASMKLSLETSEDVEEIKRDVSMLKETMRIDGVQEHKINQLGKAKVIKSLGGYKSPAYQEMSSRVFARFWRDFKNHFVIPRYGELPRVDFDAGIDFIRAWQPDTSTRLEIDAINKQQVLKGVI